MKETVRIGLRRGEVNQGTPSSLGDRAVVAALGDIPKATDL